MANLYDRGHMRAAFPGVQAQRLKGAGRKEAAVSALEEPWKRVMVNDVLGAVVEGMVG